MLTLLIACGNCVLFAPDYQFLVCFVNDFLKIWEKVYSLKVLERDGRVTVNKTFSSPNCCNIFKLF